MQLPSRAQLFSSGAGIALLTLLVAFAAFVFFPAHLWASMTVGCGITFLFALAAWSGVFWRGEIRDSEPKSWAEWVVVFFLGALLSAFFLWLDAYVFEGLPGFSAVFTIAALALTFIALPSALRSWLLEKLAGKHNDA